MPDLQRVKILNFWQISDFENRTELTQKIINLSFFD